VGCFDFGGDLGVKGVAAGAVIAGENRLPMANMVWKLADKT
jgi:hypothetical protein